MPYDHNEYLEGLINEIFDQELPYIFKETVDRQNKLIDALSDDSRNIPDLPNVEGIGVGFQYQKGIRTEEIGPVVFVTKKVHFSELSEKDRIPLKIIVEHKEYRVDVKELGSRLPLCIHGVPTVQHIPSDPIRPSSAIVPLVPGTTNISPNEGGGTAGLIVKDRHSPDIMVLTAAHVISYGMDLGHPWSSIKNYGPHAHTAAGLDASACKVERANPLFHCFGRANPPIDAVAGMRVKKSGAITGITTSTVSDVVRFKRAGKIVLIEGTVEHRIFSRVTKLSYAEPGDSGSVSLAGSSIQPSDFGAGLNVQFEAIIQGMDASIASHLRRVWALRFTNAVVGLNTEITTDRKTAYSIPIKRVLDALAVDIVYQ